MQIQRHPPFGRLVGRRVYTLPVEQINPFVRIAHRVAGTLNIAQRIIFDHELVLIVAGTGVLRTPAGDVPFTPGTLLFIRPFWPHAFSSGATQCVHLAVHFDFAPGVPRHGADPERRNSYEVRLSGGLTIPATYDCRSDDDIYVSLASLIQARASATPVSAIEERACLLRVLACLFRGSENRGNPASPLRQDQRSGQRNRQRVERAIGHIEGHFAESLDADDLARVAGLSPSHFTRLFREHTGHAPMEYLRRLRVAKARRLLADVDLSIKEVAARCGFDDPYHFSKVFHQIDGLPPSLYREAILPGTPKPEDQRSKSPDSSAR